MKKVEENFQYDSQNRLKRALRYIDPSGWLAGSGGPSYPINTVTIEGQLYIVLPEFTVTSTPILDNEFVYTPYWLTRKSLCFRHRFSEV